MSKDEPPVTNYDSTGKTAQEMKDSLSGELKRIDKKLGQAPLPYKGMNVRAEVARSIIPEVFTQVMLRKDQYISTINAQEAAEEVAELTLIFTDELLKQLNQ